MLYSTESCVLGKKRPHFSLWFGNFFEPYYSDRDLVEKGMKEIAEMGFNSIILDSKLWEDFTDFFETGAESDYVAMQKFMVECCKKEGMGINFLTLFYNGDNLYPHIRDSAPDIISPVIDKNAQVFRGYKHWDKNQTAAMVKHTSDLYRLLAGDAAAKTEDDMGNQKTPCYFYHSPAVMPSFDEDGIRVYTEWLKAHYENIDMLNKEYQSGFESFESLCIKELWPELTADDYKDKNSVRFKIHKDNMLFKQDILDEFYKELTQGVRKELPDIYLYDCLSQWKYFLPDWVEISNRGLDIWRLGKHLDCPSFYTLPVDVYGEPNCYVVSLENAILRSASKSDDIVGGLFLGRYLYNDIYNYVTPGEAIASAFSAGVTDMFFYGYSGLDDGGNFGKWTDDRKLSVKNGLDWFSNVREISGKRVNEKKAAIIFPYASYTLDNRNLNDKAFRSCRNDLLGYYQQLADLGINADIIDRSQISEEILNAYSVVILPSDPFYTLLPDENLENSLITYARNGGTIIAGASSMLHGIFEIKTSCHKEDSIHWEETITDFSQEFMAFENVEKIAEYCSDGETAIGKKSFGKGTVYTLGIDMGQCYCERKNKPVPVAYGRQAQYPLTVIKRTPIEKWLTESGLSKGVQRGIERIAFENGMLIINHTSYDYKITESYNKAYSAGVVSGNILTGHNSIFLQK